MLCSDYVIFSHATLPGAGEVIERQDACQEGRLRRRPHAKKAAAKKAAAKKAPAKKSQLRPAKKASEPRPRRRRSCRRTTSRCPPAPTQPPKTAKPPRGYKIKGNADSGLYHVPGSAFYDRTVAEIWFKTAEDAEAAGFQLPPKPTRRRARR